MANFRMLKRLFTPRQSDSILTPSDSYDSLLSLGLDALLHNYPDAACYFDNNGEVLLYNEKMLNLLKLNSEKKIDSQPQFLSQHFNFKKALKGTAYEVEDHLKQNGKSVHVTITYIPLQSNENFMGVFCTVQARAHIQSQSGDAAAELIETDATSADGTPPASDPHKSSGAQPTPIALLSVAKSEQWPSLSNSNETSEYVKRIFNQLGFAVWSVDTKGKQIVFLTDAIEALFEMKKEDITTDTWKTMTHPDDLDELKQQHDRLLTLNRNEYTYRIVTPSGKTKWVKEQGIVVRDHVGDVVRLIGTIEDTTHIMVLQDKLEKKANYDALTQLPNRYQARLLLKKLISEKRYFTLMYINLDDFSRINYAFGHSFGDKVFQKIATKITYFIRDYGELFRVDGDELIAILDNLQENKEVNDIVQQLLNVIKTPLVLDSDEIFLSASIGICSFPEDGQDIVTLTKNARAALSEAKALGKGEAKFFSTSMNIEKYKSFQLENDLRGAFNKKELYLEYQPQIDAKTQKVMGVEALIRWKHPVWGIVSPAEFIPVAESGQMIDEIGKFVIDRVCEQAWEWIKNGIPYHRIAFNLSPTNFIKHNIFVRLKNNIEKYDIEPSTLTIEITEQLLLKETDNVHQQLRKLKSLGVQIALDDYGVGYSSLQYLKKYPVDVIKIDQSFIQSMMEDDVDTILVKSILDLAKALGKKTVAEGVETRDQFHILKKMGIDFIQGYFFSHPKSVTDVKQLFLQGTIQPKVKEKTSVDRRHYYRIILPQALKAKMTILAIQQKKVTMSSTEILVQDIGLGGIQFMSQLRLTPEVDILYGFEINLFENTLNYQGKIVWSREKAKGIFEYGVQFVIKDPLRNHLSPLLKKLRDDDTVEELSTMSQFINEPPLDYIREHYL